MHGIVATALCRRAGGDALSASTQRGGYKNAKQTRGEARRWRVINPKGAHHPEIDFRDYRAFSTKAMSSICQRPTGCETLILISAGAAG